MKIANDKSKSSPDGAKRESARNADGKRVRKAAIPKTRQRCRPRADKDKAAEHSIEADVLAAMPQIVRANVRKAKQGSLVHTKWLWGVVEKMPKSTGAKNTLAELLMEQLPGGQRPTERDEM